MKKFKELKYTDLRNDFDSSTLDFKDTSEVEPFNGIIGQQRALEAIKSAMQIPQKGFNLYVSGSVGIGKTAYALSVVNKLSQKQPVPKDYCYIHNFDNPNEPIAICLDAGMGSEFKQDMNRFITSLLARLSKDLSGDMYEKEKKNILDRYARAKENIMKEFDKSTYEQGFKVRNTEGGIYFSPVHNGVILNEKDFNILDEKTKKYFEEKSPQIQEQTLQVLKELDALDKKAEQVIEEWQSNLTTFAVTQCMSDLKIKYKKNLKIQNFLYAIQSDAVKNVDLFKQYEDSLKKPATVSAPSQLMLQNFMQKKDTKPWENYRVNLLVDNDRLTHAPVVLCKNPNYFDLFGKLEFETTSSGTRTNYKLLKPGLVHKANGGYLIINIRDLLNSAPTWEAFKRVLRNQELAIDSSRDIAQPVTVVSLKPEPIPIKMQVILIGSELHYQQLCAIDVDFKKLFKVKADFDDYYERNKENVKRFVEHVSYICKKYELLPVTPDGIKELIEYSSRCAGDQNRLTAIMQDITDVVIESSFIASSARKKKITEAEVTKALATKVKRFSRYNDQLNKMICDGDIIISTDGEKIGQINGLTIAVTGDCSFGQPVRITANTFIGKSGVVNIEREVEMSGTTHSKGVYILSAYIGEKYAQENPLSLTASICFEQLYNGIDGDSASSTELYAILSSLAGVPIKQSLAVTGSVNQKGEIQPIGGVTDKIEGFFKICKSRGLNGENGVLIPYQNVKNLTLSDEVIEAVKENQFHIYPIYTIDQGIEILTGIKAGQLDENGKYEKDSINYLVSEKLRGYAEKSKQYNN
ncbi:MAG: AAA family ATPase [Clostridia bacterium]|nr:AAA family ATPase [Clostridia bacterium]